MNFIYIKNAAILIKTTTQTKNTDEESTMDKQTGKPATSNPKVVKYVVIGAGPAAICAIPRILQSGVTRNDILWIDPQFKVGEFGTTLSVGSSVPGNTAVEDYQKVNAEIFELLPACAPAQNQQFEIDNLHPRFVCSLKTASESLQHITDRLRSLIPSVEGKVSGIITTEKGLTIEMTLSDGTSHSITTRRTILATGATAKTFQLPVTHHKIKLIHPNVAFIQTSLDAYLREHPGTTTVAVIGSSHSAALATMHLLKAGMCVKQFMNKEYKYATPTIATDGRKYTMYDNTGLKGDVAHFTKQLLAEINAGTSEYQDRLQLYIGKDREDINRLLEKNLSDCSHAVAAIGYETANTLHVNGLPLSTLSHNNKTTAFQGVKGLFGIGVAFPLEVKAISGEVESAVGVGKFWSTVSDPEVLEFWDKNPAESDADSEAHLSMHRRQ
jgi:thioredoxin reductase